MKKRADLFLMLSICFTASLCAMERNDVTNIDLYRPQTDCATIESRNKNQKKRESNSHEVVQLVYQGGSITKHDPRDVEIEFTRIDDNTCLRLKRRVSFWKECFETPYNIEIFNESSWNDSSFWYGISFQSNESRELLNAILSIVQLEGDLLASQMLSAAKVEKLSKEQNAISRERFDSVHELKFFKMMESFAKTTAHSLELYKSQIDKSHNTNPIASTKDNDTTSAKDSFTLALELFCPDFNDATHFCIELKTVAQCKIDSKTPFDWWIRSFYEHVSVAARDDKTGLYDDLSPLLIVTLYGKKGITTCVIPLDIVVEGQFLTYAKFFVRDNVAPKKITINGKQIDAIFGYYDNSNITTSQFVEKEHWGEKLSKKLECYHKCAQEGHFKDSFFFKPCKSFFGAVHFAEIYKKQRGKPYEYIGKIRLTDEWHSGNETTVSGTLKENQFYCYRRYKGTVWDDVDKEEERHFSSGQHRWGYRAGVFGLAALVCFMFYKYLRK